MKILHLANHCHEIGNGIMNVAVDLACCAADAGHTVGFASAGGSYVDLLRKHGVEHFEVLQNWRAPWTLPKSAVQLNDIIGKRKPDIVHAHMMTGAVLARLIRGGARWRLVTTVHNEWQRSAIAMGVGDRVIAVSAAVADRMASRSIPARKIDIVRNGPLNTPRRSAVRATDGVPLSHPAILTVAGLYVRKGIGDLISAFEIVARQHATVMLYIVGDGPDRRLFETQAQQSIYSTRIVFLGFRPDAHNFFSQADIFVLASHSEPFGLVIAEAREAGCAVVASNVGGIPEVLEGGKAGVLVPPKHPKALANALIKLLDDADLLGQWRQAAGKGLDWLHVSRVSNETIKVYNRALGIEYASLSS